MVQMNVTITDELYDYLQERARSQGMSLDQVVSDLLAADLAWQRSLAEDPMRSLFGQIEDSFDVAEIDHEIYERRSP
jgi:hypothetical protein